MTLHGNRRRARHRLLLTAAMSLLCVESLSPSAVAYQQAAGSGAGGALLVQFAELRHRLVQVAEPVAARIHELPEAQVSEEIVEANRIRAEGELATAKADHLMRRMELSEYEMQTSLLDTSKLDGEIQLADQAVGQAKDSITALDRAINQATRASDAATVEKLQLQHKGAAIDLTRAELEAKHARARRELFEKFEKPKTLTNLKARVEEAKANELAVTLQAREAANATTRAREKPRTAPAAELEPVMGFLAKAFNLESELRQRFGTLDPKNPSQTALKEIEELLNQLSDQTDEAEQAWDTLRLSELTKLFNAN